MHIAIAFAAPEAKRRNSSGFQRLNKEDFLKLALNQQKRYVEQYPQTSHRFLIKGPDIESKAEGQLVPTKKKKTDVATRANEASKAMAPTDDIFERRRKFDEAKKRDQNIRKDIKDLNQSNVAAITPASLSAVDKIQTHELRAASENIVKNKEQIVSAVKDQASKQPHMFKRGLDSIKRVIGRETEPKELSVTERYAMERSITSIATMCMFGAGILAFGIAGAPMGVIAGRVLFDMWAQKGKGKHLADDLGELRDARKRKENMKRKEREAQIAERDGLAYQYDQNEGGSKYNDDDALQKEREETKRRLERKDDLAKLGNEKAKKETPAAPKSSKKDQMKAAASSYDPHEDDETINLVIDQIADILKYQSVEDIKESRDDMFKTTASNVQGNDQLEYLLTLAMCHGFEQTDQGMYFKSGNISDVRSICQNTLGMRLESYEGGVFNYAKENCLVSFGKTAPDTYYIRSIGPLR
jgi:hypothetical protein